MADVQRIVGCAGKERFDTHAEALKVCERMRRHTSGRRRLETYRCPYCAGWHIGERKMKHRRKL